MAEAGNEGGGRRGFFSRITVRERRKLEARRRGRRNLWFGLGMFGLVGWSVAVPTLLCLALGIWIDAHHSSRYSWTLMLLVVGIALGCFNAWYWIRYESRDERREP